VLALIRYRQQAKLDDTVRRCSVQAITKLDDALLAGDKKHARQCTLILTEGDSAKTFAVSGVAIVGRERYGVFPLKGKLLNVRDAKHYQIAGNEELKQVATILGLSLRAGQQNSDFSTLRYGRLMIMADQVFTRQPPILLLVWLVGLSIGMVGLRITMDLISRGSSSMSSIIYGPAFCAFLDF
jgi:DNA gyrase/topoisomerase IV subunit B